MNWIEDCSRNIVPIVGVSANDEGYDYEILSEICSFLENASSFEEEKEEATETSRYGSTDLLDKLAQVTRILSYKPRLGEGYLRQGN